MALAKETKKLQESFSKDNQNIDQDSNPEPLKYVAKHTVTKL
jgi:hypothetical protein